MATYTPNYGLHQWVPEDTFLRTDFNTDFEKIDTALSGLNQAKPELVTGTYTGNGESSQYIELGFAPKAVLVISNRGDVSAYGGLALPDTTVYESHSQKVLEITDTGFTTYGAGSSWAKGNSSGSVFHYLAVR